MTLTFWVDPVVLQVATYGVVVIAALWFWKGYK